MALTASFAHADDHVKPVSETAKVYFINLKDGQTVSNPVKVQMGLSGMGVAPAGVDKKHTGHHHIFINREAFGKDDIGANIPKDENHVHFGGGQTEATVKLKPGKNTLQLVVGDMNHIPHGNGVVSKRITVNVK